MIGIIKTVIICITAVIIAVIVYKGDKQNG